MMDMDMHMDGWDIMPGPLEIVWGLLGLAITVLFWLVLAVLVVKLLKNRPFTGYQGSPALQVLEERYARGEITREEFFERRAVLSGTDPPG